MSICLSKYHFLKTNYPDSKNACKQPSTELLALGYKIVQPDVIDEVPDRETFETQGDKPRGNEK